MDKKFERNRTKDQEQPQNPTGKRERDQNEVDIDERTIKDQQNK